MIRFLLSEDAKTIHAENPESACNIPTARAEGEKGTDYVNFGGAAMAWTADHYKICEHCIGTGPTDPKEELE